MSSGSKATTRITRRTRSAVSASTPSSRTVSSTSASRGCDDAIVVRAGESYPRVMLGYQEQDSSQTLREGLAEYYRANPGIVTRPANLPAESVALFRSHDMCHVIFGL